jgi:hypothetical protein
MHDRAPYMPDRDSALPCDRPAAGYAQHEEHGQPGSDHGNPSGAERDLPVALHAPAPLPSTVIVHQRP